MEPPGGRDSRFNLGYSMNLLSGETPPEIYGGSLGRPSTSLQQLSPRHTMVPSACGTRGGINKSDVCYDERGMTPQQGMGLEACGVNDMNDEPYNSLQSKKSPPSNGKKTKGRVKIKMEYIENKLRRYTTFSKRKTGIMKKAYELSTLTGTQVMLLVASETGHVYTFATRKLQPMITSEAGKALIQTCLNSPDPPAGSIGGDQRMSATGFEETELTYNVSDEESKENECESSEGEDDDSDEDDTAPPEKVFVASDMSHCPKSMEKLLNPGMNDRAKFPVNSEVENENLFIKNEDIDEPMMIKITKEAKIKEDQSPIISQIKQINHALIQSNKAAAAAAQSTSASSNSSQSSSSLNTNQPVLTPTSNVVTVSTSNPSPSISPMQLANSVANTITQQPTALQVAGNAKAVPLLVSTPNGVGFASVSDGMILGMLQGSSEPKFVAMPLSSLAAAGIGVAINNSSTKNEDVR